MLPGRDNNPGFPNGPIRQRSSSGGGQFSQTYIDRMTKWAAASKSQSISSGDDFLTTIFGFGFMAGIIFLIYAAIEWLHLDVILKPIFPIFQNLGKWLFEAAGFLLGIVVVIYMAFIGALAYLIILVGHLLDKIF